MCDSRKEVMAMNDKQKILKLLNSSKSGMISTSEVTSVGIHRGVLKDLVDSGELSRFSRGLYVRNNSWEDDLYLLQQKYKRGVYSHDTALYLLGYSDRTPATYTMTFPKGYNTPSLKDENINIVRVVEDNYFLFWYYIWGWLV